MSEPVAQPVYNVAFSCQVHASYTYGVDIVWQNPYHIDHLNPPIGGIGEWHPQTYWYSSTRPLKANSCIIIYVLDHLNRLHYEYIATAGRMIYPRFHDLIRASLVVIYPSGREETIIDVNLEDKKWGMRTFCANYRPQPAYEGFCGIFLTISNRLQQIGDKFTDLSNLGSSWWVVDSLTDKLFGNVAAMFIELADFFKTVNTWCLAVTDRLLKLLDMAELRAELENLFGLSTIFSFFNTIDDWFDQKIYELGLLLPDWLPDNVEEFKKIVSDLTPKLPDWFPSSYESFKMSILELLPELPDWLPTSRDELVTLIKDVIAEVSTVPENLDAWLDAQIDKYKDKVINWVAEEFFTILDKVFEKEV